MKENYTIVSGTNRPGSNTLKIARHYQSMLKDWGIEAQLVSLEGLDVSQRNSQIRDLEAQCLEGTQKFIFISPEYNGSIPGVLKSLFDNSNIQPCWWGKKALLTGVSTGRAGNLRGMEHLTGILHYLKMVVHPNKLPISVVNLLLGQNGNVIDEPTQAAMSQQLEEFISF